MLRCLDCPKKITYDQNKSIAISQLPIIWFPTHEVLAITGQLSHVTYINQSAVSIPPHWFWVRDPSRRQQEASCSSPFDFPFEDLILTPSSVAFFFQDASSVQLLSLNHTIYIPTAHGIEANCCLRGSGPISTRRPRNRPSYTRILALMYIHTLISHPPKFIPDTRPPPQDVSIQVTRTLYLPAVHIPICSLNSNPNNTCWGPHFTNPPVQKKTRHRDPGDALGKSRRDPAPGTTAFSDHNPCLSDLMSQCQTTSPVAKIFWDDRSSDLFLDHHGQRRSRL